MVVEISNGEKAYTNLLKRYEKKLAELRNLKKKPITIKALKNYMFERKCSAEMRPSDCYMADSAGAGCLFCGNFEKEE